MRRARATTLLASALAAAATAACGTPGTRPDGALSGTTAVAALPAAREGLELRRFFVPIDPLDRRVALGALQAEGLITPITAATTGARPVDAEPGGVGADDAPATADDAISTGPMAPCGLALYRCRDADLAAIIVRLGESPQMHSTILGTLRDWAETETVRIEGGRTVFLGGRPRTLPDALLRLSLRGWCFPTTDGARARVEVRLTTEEVRGERPSLDLTPGRTRAKELEGGRALTEIAPGESLLILEIPLVPPEDAAADGLAVAPPPTPAALLLAERAIAGRATILVVSAGFADMLPTPEGAPEGNPVRTPGRPSTAARSDADGGAGAQEPR